MKTNEKMDFLMKITNTANSALGKNLSFDASYISRIRSGKRSFPKNQEFLERVAAFFGERIKDDYQKKMLGELISPGKDWPENERLAQKMICQWLSQPDHADSAPVGKILSGISSVQNAGITAIHPVENEEALEHSDVSFFYGDQGKREAVSQFLSEVGQMEQPPQLLLYSNEEFNWMYEDPAFARKWAALLFTYIKKGGKIKIAHTISRASGEMLVALQKWIPVYMTGAIEPYYYPKILDRVFRKTLFIAEGHSAIVASSVGEHTEHAWNCLIRDPEAVGALEQEYWNFFGFCKPLMKIFNGAGKEKFFEVLETFHGECENTITVRTTPSFYTMPKEVAKSMTERLDSSWMIKRQEKGEQAFREMMDNGNVLTEILNLPLETEILEGKVPFPMCDLFDKPGLFYTAKEFAAHLEQVIIKMKQYENYHVVVSSAIPINEIVYVKEDTGVILVKSDMPAIAFAINEQRMVSAFWDYLNELKDSGKKREKTIQYLEKFLNKLLEEQSCS